MNNAFDDTSLSFDDIDRKLSEASFCLKKAALLLVNRGDYRGAEGALNLAVRIDVQRNNL